MQLHIVRYMFLLTLMLPFYCLASVEALARTTTIKIPNNSPTVTLLGTKFVLVNDVRLPSQYSLMRQRWKDILEKHKQEIFSSANIPLPGQHKHQWIALSQITVKSPISLKTLRNINGFFNSIASQEDKDFYGKNEYWASPEEFLTNRRGDCEDYAITKYFALQYFKWPKKDLWLIFLHDKINVGGHAVLYAKMGNKEFILDNLSKPKYLLIPAKQYEKQVDPIAIANHQGIWLKVNSKGTSTVKDIMQILKK